MAERTDQAVSSVPGHPARRDTGLSAAPTFAIFEDAYRHNLELVISTGAGNAARGATSRERLGVSFTLRDPRARLVANPVRRSNLVFNFAEFLWYAAGRDDVAMPSHYAPSVAGHSVDGRTLNGTAYGPRLFGPIGFGGRPQWDCAVGALREDPESKRAYLSIALPHEDRSLANPDVACTLGLQFLIRDGRLHAIAYMRANDAYRGVVSDVFSFTMLQEHLARTLDVPLGEYVHVAGSYHIYDTDLVRAEELLASRTDDSRAAVMPAMPAGDQRSAIETVIGFEARLRSNELPLSDAALAGAHLPPYWQNVVILFELHRQVTYGRDHPSEWLARLPASYQELMRQRFPVLTEWP